MSLKKPIRTRLLLVGDSIRQSYQPAVADALGGAFDVVGMPLNINCRNTRTTLHLLESLNLELRPTCIHWNNGLHDVKRQSDSGLLQVPLEEYERNIYRLLDTFRVMCDGHVIWCRTTPVIESRHNIGRAYSRFNRDIDLYNSAADKIMCKAGVLIHDLHRVLDERLDETICEDGVHLTATGVRLATESIIRQVHKFSVGVPA